MTRTFKLCCIAAALAAALAGCNTGGSEKELVASAKALRDKHELAAATIQLKSALQKNPQSADARLLLGKTLLDSGDPVNALVELRKAQELQVADEQVVPDLARAMLVTGEQAKLIVQYGDLQLKDNAAAADLKTSLAAAYALQSDLEKARVAVADALRLQPGFAPAMIVFARLKGAEGDIDGALAVLEQVLGAEPGNERAGVFKGEILRQAKNDAAGALAALRQVLNAHPEATAAQAAVVDILLQQQEFAQARTEFDKLKKAAPNHPETLFYEAQFAFIDKNYKTTREITSRILKVMPDNVRVLELAGAAEYRMKEYLQAEALLGRALKNAPRQVRTRQLLAQSYLRSSQPDKAVAVLQPVIDTPRADGASLALAGEAYLQLGDTKRSDDAMQRAVKAAPTDARVRTSAAMAQLAHGNSGSAIAELEHIAGESTLPRADLALISARLNQKDLDGALKAIDALQKKLPADALPLNLRGRVLLLKRDTAGATKNFEAALAKDPTYFPAVASLASLDVVNGKPDAARARFDALLKAQPKSYQAKLALAELDIRSGAAPATVLATLKEAAKLNPSEPAPHLVLINRLLDSGDAKAALAASQDATAALPNNLQIMDALGRSQVAAGDAQRAISTFKKLSALQPRNALHEVRLAEAYMAAQDRSAAAAALRHAVEVQPDLLPARRGLAMLAVMDKRPQDAVAIAREMQQRNPKDASGFALEGELQAGSGSWGPAVTAYRAALQRGKSADTVMKLHAALTADGKQPEAERLAADWLKDNPRDTVFLYYLGDVALARNDIAVAEARYRDVLQTQPNNALALNNVAWLMVKQNKPGAVALAEQANKLLPDRAPLLDTLASAQGAENQLPKAIETQKRAIELKPGDPTLSLNLARLFVRSGDKARARAELETLAKLGDKFTGQAEVASLLKSL